MTTKRPVNLDIGTIKLPITAIVSILHRISGVILFAVVAVLLWTLDLSLSGEEGFAAVRECLASPVAKVVLWGCLAALAYHVVAGVRHLIMDLGIGESLEGGRLGAKLVMIIAVVLILLAGVWVW
ncbi:MAG: succinate dehydrogenase, cytochrome b556 subunit [Bacteroidales bacterium]|nr:succinate dehydrogenase, cytochrome b556 subunit [Bacteroidales bacterium]